MISKAALIDSNNIVQNIVQWTEDSHVPSDFNLTAIVLDNSSPVNLGWKYDNKTKTFSDPNPFVPETPTADQNRQTATALLLQTDWATLPDVSNNSRKPFLLNQSDFLTYRNALRKIATNPVEGIINWPTKPVANWSK